MPAWGLRLHAAALLGYVCVALMFTWPLPLHIDDALPGLLSGDSGVYIWNLWLFRHEIVEHHRLPFQTFEILTLAPPVPLALHNYTTFANVLAFPLLSCLSPVATYNVLLIAAGPAAAYAMFLFVRVRVQDDAAAWLGGLLFGFSPFMSARATEHFSLLLAAPLPIFALVLYRFMQEPTARLAIAAGLVMAWAFLSDVYFAVYCLLMTGFVAAYSAVTVRPHPAQAGPLPLIRVVDVSLLSFAGLTLGIVLTGGWRFELAGIGVSMTNLYTPVLVLTALLIVRAWLSVRGRLAWTSGVLMSRQVLLSGLAAASCALALAPVLYAAASSFGERGWVTADVMWRHSAPGVDLLALLLPNPLHPWAGTAGTDWLRTLPNGVVENVASVAWVAALAIVVAIVRFRFRPPPVWVVFTTLFVLMALGPFIRIGGYHTYVPTPWTLLRYVPIVGAARMPTRLSVMVIFCVAVLFAMALRHVRGKSRHPALLAGCLGALLLFELLPAPRRLHAVAIPSVIRLIAEDPRPLSVLNIPFGIRDGVSAQGRFSTEVQFQQTIHQKPLVSAYVSRLPRRGVAKYQRNPVTRALMLLSEGRPIDPRLHRAALDRARDLIDRLQVGYVVVDRSESSDALVAFVQEAFELTFVARDGPIELYQTFVAD